MASRPRVVVLERIHDEGVSLLSEFASVQVILGLSRTEILGAVRDADALVVRSVVHVDGELMDHAPGLRVIGRAGTGLDNIDVDGARLRNVAVVRTPKANAESTADYAVAQMLCLARNFYRAQDFLRQGDFRRHCLTGRELSALTIGIFGLGNVGRAVARRLRLGFGAHVVGYDPNPAHPDELHTLVEQVEDPDEVFRRADILTFHTSLGPSSRKLLNQRTLDICKPGVLVVNAARAGVIDDDALWAALNSEKVAAAAVDVLDPEPNYDLPPGTQSYRHPLFLHPNLIFTPHMAASTSDAQSRIGRELAHNLRHILIGDNP